MKPSSQPTDLPATVLHTVNPFLALAHRHSGSGDPFDEYLYIALRGARNGYIMLAPAAEITQYAELPLGIWTAAQAWAVALEQGGSPRVYTVIWSEVTRHLHLHLFPRWPEDSLRGAALFESRDTQPQPAWLPETLEALTDWARAYQVLVG